MLETTTKLFKSGNANAVQLNKALSQALNAKPGDPLKVRYDPATKSVIINRNEETMTVSADFKGLLEAAYRENQGVMALLKDL